jgi:hypothetical protein
VGSTASAAPTGLTVNVAVKVTLPPLTEGLSAEVTCSDVAAAATENCAQLLVEAPKFASPEYAASKL